MVQKEENKVAERNNGGVMVVKPKLRKGFTSKAIDWLEWTFVKMMHDPKLPLHYLSGNFAPVDETPPQTDLVVKGQLRECLNGEFVRVGPNPKFAPVTGYHWYEMRFNMKNGLVSQKRLSVSAVDFPRVNENYTGRKQRYVFATILDSIIKVTGIIKFDLHAEPEAGKKKLEVGGNVQGIFDLGPGRFGSEAVFVPRQPGTTSEEDDDGYLIFFSHDENTGYYTTSKFCSISSQTI